jgi:N-acetylmuramic acid 6-phosphate etherase
VIFTSCTSRVTLICGETKTMSNQSEPFLIGIDGGGTKTVALLSDLEGRVLGHGLGGPSNYQVVGLRVTSESLHQAIRAAFADANIEPVPPRAVCLGLSGVDRPDDYAAMRAWADEQMPGTQAVIVNDAMLVMAAGTPEGWGIAMISGTGSIVYGRAQDGHMTRAGGWGYLLGDEGSGYDIGLAALRAIVRADDGRAPQTALTRMILDHWSLATPQGLVSQVYFGPVPTQKIAALASVVEVAAATGDPVAIKILREASHELALAVSAVARRLEMQGPIPCALAGSTVVKGRIARQMFVEAAASLGLQLDPVRPVSEPAQGALRLARESLREAT